MNGNPAQNQWERGGTAFAQSGYGIDVNVTSEAMSNFEQHYLMSSLGRGRELGYATDSCLSYLAKFYIGEMTSSNYNHYLLCNGRVPTIKSSSGQWFTSWSDLKTGYDSSWQSRNYYDTLYPYDYTFLGMTALSYLKCEPNGGNAAWAIAQSEMQPSTILNTDPKFAIVPRDCFSPATNVSENNSSDEISVYPNPSNGKTQVAVGSGSSSQYSLEVYNSIGEKIFSKTVNSKLETLNLNEANGIYFLSIKSNNKIYNQKLIINK